MNPKLIEKVLTIQMYIGDKVIHRLLVLPSNLFRRDQNRQNKEGIQKRGYIAIRSPKWYY